MSAAEKPNTPPYDASSVEKGQGEHSEDTSLPPAPDLTEEQEKKLWRKIDLRLMPVLSLMYLFAFLDRGNIGNARLDGLTTQLHLVGNQYNIALTMFFIPYCIFECPANLVLKKFRPSRWLPGITMVWGVIMTCMGLVKTYPQLVGVRVCLGIAEAGLFPGVVYYLTFWYPRHALQYRIGLFFGAATIAGAFSGLLAYAINFMGGTHGKLGWSWIFILEGSATVGVGFLAALTLVDFPSTAKFLTPEERAFVIRKIKLDISPVGEEYKFSIRYVWAALLDWQIYIQILIYMSIITPLYGITLFLPTIIKSFGYDTAISQLLTVPIYVVATCVLLSWAYLSDKLKMRYPFVLAGLTFCLIGYAINISNAPSGVKYFGTYFIVAGSYSAFPGIVAWLGNNLSPQYKRGVGMALHIGVGNFGGAIASNIYLEKDAPRYIMGHGLELMFVGIGFICTPIVVIIYKRINAQRDAIQQVELSKYTDQQLREMGDRAPDFRYTL